MGNSVDASPCSDIDFADRPGGGGDVAAAEKAPSRAAAIAAEEAAHWYTKMCESKASQDLFDASVFGDAKRATSALVKHGSPNCCNAEGLTALMMAAAGGHTDVVRILVTSGARVNAMPNSIGLSPIGLAAARGSLEVVRLLQAWRADPNVGRWRGNAPLARAAEAGHCEICQLLLAGAADMESTDEAGSSALMRAVQAERLEAAQLLLRSGACVVRADRASRSALSRVVDVLLQEEPLVRLRAHGGLMNPRSERDYWAEMCDLMVERKANSNIVDDRGDTLLCRAVRYGSQQVVRMLLQLGADRDFPVPSVGGGTALLQAVLDRRRDLCEVLLARAASVNQPSTSGVSPLCGAIERGDEELSCFLIQRGAAFDVRDPRTGETLLMKAAARGMVGLYRQLRPLVLTPALAGDSGMWPTDVGNSDAEYEYFPESSEEET